MTWSKAISGIAVLGAGVGLLLKGEGQIGTALIIAGAAELGAGAILKP